MTVMTPPGTPTIRLAGAGTIPAAPASEIEACGTLIWDGILTSTIEHAETHGRHVRFIYRDNTTGVTHRADMPADRLVAYYSTDEVLERGLRGIYDADNVAVSDLFDHIGRQISTPDGWRTLVGVREHATGFEAIASGALSRVPLRFGQFVGVRGDRVCVEPCGCLTLNVQVLGHRPACKRSEPIDVPGDRG